VTRFPYIEKIGLRVYEKPKPHVRCKQLIRVLDQWRYGLAYRLWDDDIILRGRGVLAAPLEAALADMAQGKCWPNQWKPEESDA
jgi:hypothetical protein